MEQNISIVLAAGRGSRMSEYDGNKTLLPLEPEGSPYSGKRPILHHVLGNLPPGPKALIVNHRKEDVIRETSSFGVQYLEQPVLNGTGGAIITSKDFIDAHDLNSLIITMGDVPLVRSSTYKNLLKLLDGFHLVILGFEPADKKQYGVLEIGNGSVKRIIEWQYWSTYDKKIQNRLNICSSGIFAARKKDLVRYIPVMEKSPHKVIKNVQGKDMEVEEFFLTDLIEFMSDDGYKIGYVLAEDEDEVMGVDDLPSLIKAQKKYIEMER